MRELYATTLRLVHIGGGDAYEVARAQALDWAWRIEGDAPNLEEQPEGRASVGEGPNVTEVAWSSFASESMRAIEIVLGHPHDEDPTMRWRATVALSEADGAVRATVGLGVGANVHVLRPSHISLRAPRVVHELMQPPLHAYAGSMQLHPGVLTVDPEDVDRLDADLRAADRALPILIAASGVEMGFAEILARGLAGLVQVVRSRDAASDDALLGVLESSGLTVPDAGMRLFWPGFGSPGQPRHPYWTKAQLGRGKADPARSVLDELMRLMAPISTARVPADPGVLKARQEQLQERRARQQAREKANRERARRQRESAQKAAEEARRLVSGGDRADHLSERLAEVEALLDLSEKEREEIEQKLDTAEENELKAVEEAVGHSERNEALEDENAALRRNIGTMNRYRDAQREQEGDPIPEELDSWEAVAEHLDDLEGPGFCFTPEARACANGKGRYPRPDLMWKSLRALEQVGRDYNELGADLGGRFEEFALERGGLTVALQDRTYTDHDFEFDGRWHSRLPHVKIDDAKAPNEVGRIYFALDDEGKRIIVDWFGTKPDRPHTKRATSVAA